MLVMGSGSRRQACNFPGVRDCTHTVQPLRKLVRSWVKEDHQNQFLTKRTVLFIPGCPILTVECVHWITLSRRVEGTNTLLCGQSRGGGSSPYASVISSIMSQRMGATICVDGRMGLGFEICCELSKSLDKASALFFNTWSICNCEVESGEKNSHLVCLVFSHLVSFIFSRFLWFVITWNGC